MARTKKEESTVKARILVDSVYGKCNTIVEVQSDDVGFEQGLLDSDKNAVEYIESLTK